MNDTTGTASAPPRAVPALKIPTASARSRIGNHSETAFNPAGKLAGSAAPRRARKNESCSAERAKPWSMFATDQADTKIRKLRRVPSRSTSRPATAYITV